MSIHKNLTTSNGIHVPYAFVYADEAARTGASGFGYTDIGKFARQTDDNTVWMLTAVTPTWKAVNELEITSEASGDIIYYDGSDWVRLAKGSNAEILTLANGLPSWAAASGGGSDGVAFYLAGTCYVGDAQIRINIPKAATVSKVVARIITAPTGADINLNVQKNGTNDILSSDLAIAASATTGTSTSIDTDYDDLAENDFITVDINQVGSTVAGADLMVALVY